MQRAAVHATLVFLVFVIGVMAVVLTNAVIDGMASSPSVTFSILSPTPPGRTGP